MGRENDCGKEKASECSRKIARVIQKQIRDLSDEGKKVNREYVRNYYRNIYEDMQKQRISEKLSRIKK